MSGSRCHRQKMMGRGAEGGCGTEEKPCPLSSRVRVSVSRTTTKTESKENIIDLYAQARKVLCERSPFEAAEDGGGGSRVWTLPVGLSTFLSRQSQQQQDGHRRKHKKSNPESKKSKCSSSSSSHHHAPPILSNIWADTQDYFRSVTLDDIDHLLQNYSLAADSSFSIPSASASNNNLAEVGLDTAAAAASNSNLVEVGLDTAAASEQQEMEIVDALPQEEEEDEEEEEKKSWSLTDLQWLLGSKHKLLLTSDRPSKKRRKVLGGEAGLEKLVVVRPFQEGDLAQCHYCCLGDTGEELNRLLLCGSCNVAVHQKCYGVKNVTEEGTWFCSWCTHGPMPKLPQDKVKKPCLLCPKEGGALKPVWRSSSDKENGGNLKFAHLFCCQWIPEIYVENREMLEPIMNVERIKDTRRKLVCYLCRVKHGVCIRCSHGTCRTSFHPICAREAKHRMEIWGKVGCDNVELKAFCVKHSIFQDIGSTQQSGKLLSGCESANGSLMPVTLPVTGLPKLTLGWKNRNKGMMYDATTDFNSHIAGKDDTLLEQDPLAMEPNVWLRPNCDDAQLSVNTPGVDGRENIGDFNQSDSLNPVLILKKLIDRGKANVNDVASEMGVSSDSLAAMLLDDQTSVSLELQSKIVKWLRSCFHMGASAQHSKLRRNSALSSGSKVAGPDVTKAVKLPGHDDPIDSKIASPDDPDAIPIQSLPPRGRMKSNIRILKDNRIIVRSSGEKFIQRNGNGKLIDENVDHPPEDMKGEGSSKESLFHDHDCHFKESEVTGKILAESSSGCLVVNSSPLAQLPGYEGNLDRMVNCDTSEQQSQPIVEKEVFLDSDNSSQAEEANTTEQNTLVKSSWGHDFSVDVASPGALDLKITESASSFYTHPFIQKRLMQMNCMFSKQKKNSESDVQREIGMISVEGTCTDAHRALDGAEGEQLVKARKMRILELSPEDEVEGEILYFQNKLLDNVVASKFRYEDLIFRVVTNLPQELDAMKKQRWDAVLVNQYLCEVREAKKQGRKERRYKEAQAVLAAATAAAAASSRVSCLRKDSHDEVASTNYESPLKSSSVGGRAGPYSQLMPRAKETLSRLAVARVSSEETFQLSSDSKELFRICDICRRSETLLNRILVCRNCKVAVHLGCYRRLKDPVGQWSCELCEDLSLQSRSPRIPPVSKQERPFSVAQCGLCAGSTGAFRKSTDGQWVHAFCAEWVLELTFRRGQPNPVEGMEDIAKEKDLLVCNICFQKFGVCIKCSYGNCQNTFHPFCAKNAGLYMNVKTGGNKFQHKAYCEKHSMEQKEKAETLRHGAEELMSIKQIRVELEKLRLLCERIIKREKLKRELVLCSHDVLASKRDSVVSLLLHSSFFPPDVSSESVTTSLKGHTHDYKPCNGAIQKSDEITVDSTVSGKRRITLPVHMDVDRKTNDTSTSQRPGIRKATDRVLFSGKQLPHRPASVSSRKSADDGEKRSKLRKHTETFQKELVMTSDQASMQNQRLPKGFAYVPINCLTKEKPVTHDTQPHESLELDG